eukprot:gnl/Chilomastix_caulleri/4706.p3 GENE.gnl/Chilomastix_caulleri/4706~~gnl/Chilomastix_caulleri/4706.p3  ORF type:complete len:61 (+),score=11.82 gnl/Chilomastix_caulleri/4706:76-258(+)
MSANPDWDVMGTLHVMLSNPQRNHSTYTCVHHGCHTSGIYINATLSLIDDVDVCDMVELR